MSRVGGTRGDPGLKFLFLFRGQPSIRSGWRHQRFGILRKDARDELARARFPRHDGSRVDRFLTGVQTEPSLTFLAVLPMTIEAIFGQDRANIPIEIELIAGGMTAQSQQEYPHQDRWEPRNPCESHGVRGHWREGCGREGREIMDRLAIQLWFPDDETAISQSTVTSQFTETDYVARP